jgi:fructose transport system substrate-binding protein
MVRQREARSRFDGAIVYRIAVLLLLALVMPVSMMSRSATAQDDGIIIGLITKTETNPFFVKMKEGAQAAADAAGAELMTASGQFDTDNASQVTAIENMITAGVDGILITPADPTAIVPTIEKAREAGVVVIALDTPTNPPEATDALFATDNFRAGVLIGQYARAAMGGCGGQRQDRHDGPGAGYLGRCLAP